MVEKSARIVLTVVAAMGMAARGQQGPDPCDAATFNAKSCKTAVRHNRFCSGGAWVPMTYQQPYPYYYDSYQAYLAGGGVVSPLPVESCPHPFAGFFGGHGVTRRGFGSTGVAHRAGG
jgi:hypothetical protein